MKIVGDNILFFLFFCFRKLAHCLRRVLSVPNICQNSFSLNSQEGFLTPLVSLAEQLRKFWKKSVVSEKIHKFSSKDCMRITQNIYIY